MTWVETSSPNFTARHEHADLDDAVAVLELIEGTRDRLGGIFTRVPDEVAVVLHSSQLELCLAQPSLPLVRLATAPAGRRYLAGWCSPREVHVLAPRLLERRASAVPGSREMAMLGPATLYTQLVLAANNRTFPPPFRPSGLARYVRWAWLAAGAAQYFSGQTAFARPAIARRLREGREPAFPPSVRDAALLGGSVFDLLAREHGVGAAVRLAYTPLAGEPRAALVGAFAGREMVHTEGAWRAHLARLAEQR
ncbi:MAG: hypothetical protein QOE27_878 [Solirubrobacteraceae bacterium]|nr:hypothetical protein [Solirubrobacteraceae bacterium]MEA2300911.1 hypothetical protein [Solirubrobacteraceae bacterium]